MAQKPVPLPAEVKHDDHGATQRLSRRIGEIVENIVVKEIGSVVHSFASLGIPLIPSRMFQDVPLANVLRRPSLGRNCSLSGSESVGRSFFAIQFA